MSKTIDEKVVSMQFDNKNFETNAKTSMSTLDKLKEKLNFTGACKGLENVATATKKVDMSGLSKGVETVHAKFSALQVIGVTALANITNQAVNAGKRIVSALTIDPVKTGFSEYETKMNSIQTIMSNTASKGTTMEDVTRVIDELNTYADKTIYNFAEMTRNIGTFTAAGVGLEESAAAIQGIANLAAASGSTSQQASTAMYQLSQALAAGTVKLMDWNSVVNAGMGGEKFQEALKATAREHGIAVDDIIKKQGSFRESLSEGWISAEILNETLNKFTVDGAQKYAKAMMESGKWTREQADALIEEAQAMEDAATKVKTFTQLWSTIQESVQSGWGKTWEILFGNFEDARELFSKISDVIGKVIDKISDTRNNLLMGALSPWDRLTEKVNAAGIETDKFHDTVKQTAKDHGIAIDDLIKEYGSLKKVIAAGKLPAKVFTDALKKLIGIEDETSDATKKVKGEIKDLGKIVDKVINGDFGNGEDRVKALTKAGYDYATVQNLVNEKLGNSVRHLSTLSEEQIRNAENLSKLSDEQLKNKGYTEEQIIAIRDLAKVADEGNTSIKELINSVSKPSGKTLIFESITHVLGELKKLLDGFREAWRNVFDPLSSTDLYNGIEKIHELAMAFEISDEAANNFKTIMEGLLSLWDLAYRFISKSLLTGLKIAGAVLELFGTNLMEVAARVAELIIQFRKWIGENTIFTDTISKVAKILHAIIDGVISCTKAFMKLDVVVDTIEKIKKLIKDFFDGFEIGVDGSFIDAVVTKINNFFSTVKTWIENLNNSENIGKDIILGLINGLKAGVKMVVNTIINIGKTLLETLCDILGVQSPSWKAFEIAQDFLLGFWNGLKDMAGKVWGYIKTFGLKCVEVLKSIDFGAVLSTALGAAMVFAGYKMLKIADNLTSAIAAPLEGLGKMFEDIGDMFEGIGANLKAKAWERKSRAILNFALALGVLAAVAIVFSKIPTEDLIKGGIALGVLAIAMIAISAAIGKISSVADVGKSSLALFGVATALLIMANAMRILASIESGKALSAIGTLIVVIAGLSTLLYVMGKLVDPRTTRSINKIGILLTKVAISFLLMIAVVKLASGISTSEIDRSLSVIAGIGAVFAGIIAASHFASKYSSKAGTLLLTMSMAMLLMVGVIKASASLTEEEVKKSVSVIAGIGAVFAGIIAVSSLAGQFSGKAGTVMLATSVSMLLMVQAVKSLSQLTEGELKRGLDTVTGISVLFGCLIAVTQFAGPNAAKAGGMLLTMSGALLVVVAAMFLLSNMNENGIERALGIVTVLELLFGGLIAVTKYAKDCKAELIVLTVAIGLLVTSVALLSLIDPKKLAVAAGSMSILIVAFSGLVAACGLIKSAKGMYKNLFSLIAIMGVLAIILGLMASMEVKPSIETATALGILLNSLATAMVILRFAGKTSMSSIGHMAVLGLVVAELGIILGLMAKFDVKPSIKTATALSILLVSMSASLLLLGVVGLMGPAAFVGIGALATLIAGIGGLIVGIGALMSEFPKLEEFLNKGIPILEKIGYAIGSFFGNIIGGFTSGITSGLPEIGQDLADFATNVRPLIDAVEVADDTFVQNAKNLASAVKSLITADLWGDLNGTASLPALGKNIADFGINAKPFFEILKELDVDASVLDGVANVASVVKEITEPGILSLIGRWMFDSLDIAVFSANLKSFGQAMVDFSNILTQNGGIDADAVDAAVNAGNLMLALQKEIPRTGNSLWTWIAGWNDLETFGENCEAFGTAMINLSNALTANGGINEEAITQLQRCGMMMVELNKEIPRTGAGSLWSMIAGDNSLWMFGENVKAFCGSMVTISNALTANGGINEEAITQLQRCGMMMVELNKEIPTSGSYSLWSLISGNNRLATFADNCLSFGQAMVALSTSLKGQDGNSLIDIGLIETVKNAGLLMIELQKELGTTEGVSNSLWSIIAGGDKTMGSFGMQCAMFGQGMQSLSIYLSGVDLSGIPAILQQCRNIIAFMPEIPKTDSVATDIGEMFGGSNDLPTFASMLVTFGARMKSFANNISGIDTSQFSSIITEVKKLIDMAKGMSGVDFEGLASFGENLRKMGNAGIDKFIKAFADAEQRVKQAGGTLLTNIISGMENKDATLAQKTTKIINEKAIKPIKNKYEDFKTCGKKVMENFINGVKSLDINTDISTLISGIISSIEDYYNDFYDAGVYLVDGFAAGIDSRTWKAKARASAMASAALKAAKEALREKSPSKAFYEVGAFAGEGLVNAFSDYEDISYKAGFNMAKSSVSGLSRAIAKAKDMVDNDLDTQPTIRPVLDLSDIANGASTINGMFGLTPSIRTLSNVGSINAMMHKRQNGNFDVVSAINDLGRKLGNMSVNHYTVNGVTYDDGSNVSNAVEALVRAARIERRT